MIISLDDVPAAALVVHSDGTIAALNDHAEALLGLSTEEVRGRYVVDVLGLKEADAGHRRGVAAPVLEDDAGALVATVGGRSFFVLRNAQTLQADEPRVVILAEASGLNDAREEAGELARSRASFLGKLSHEIRSAVASMTGFAETLKDEVSEPNREIAGIIALSGRHLMDTLNAVMDLAKVEFGEKEVEMARVEIVRRIGDRVTILRSEAEEKGLELTFDPDEDEVYAHLNPVYFDRIVHNLIDNAVKYTEEGRVEVDVERRDGRIWLYVADTGRGMDAAFIPRLFAPFEREEPEGGSSSGSGLGLTVTRHLVELMQGRIYACSTAGVGSTFTVQFPDPAIRPAGSRKDDTC